MDITPEQQSVVITKTIYTHPDDPNLTATVRDGQVEVDYSNIEGSWSATLPTTILGEVTDLFAAVVAAEPEVG
jgi:hypothetical protein